MRTCRRCGASEEHKPFYANGKNICKSCWCTKVAEDRDKLRAKGLCIGCRIPSPDGSLCTACKEGHLRRYYANREEYNDKARDRRQRLKLDAFDAYGGPCCVCCGEKHSQFLTIDHVAQDGAAHRQKLRAESGWANTRSAMCGATFYAWLKKHDYPEGFRVLCFNCNFAIGHFGKCPHRG
jgi:hypothetical protein